MLSELQAWEHMFQGFSNPVVGYIGVEAHYCQTGDLKSWYICGAICDLKDRGHITLKTYDQMLRKLERYGLAHRTTLSGRAFYWPKGCTVERARFCKLMVDYLYAELYIRFGLFGSADPEYQWYI